MMRIVVILVCCFLISLNVGAGINDGLIAYYSFEKTGDLGFDSSGRGFHGSTYGVEQVPGKVGNGGYFGGAGKIVVDAFRNYEWGKSLTVSVWVNKVVEQRDFAGVVNSGYYEDGSWEFRLTPDNRGGQVSVGVLSILGRSGGDCKSGNLSLSEWHHVLMTYDGEAVRFYVDGKLQICGDDDAGRLLVKDQPLTIGQAGLGSPRGQYFTGVIDDVRLYDRVLGASEIQQLAGGEDVEVMPEPAVSTSAEKLFEAQEKPEQSSVPDMQVERPVAVRRNRADVVDVVTDRETECCQKLNELIVDWKSGNREKAIRALDTMSRNYQP